MQCLVEGRSERKKNVIVCLLREKKRGKEKVKEKKIKWDPSKKIFFSKLKRK